MAWSAPELDGEDVKVVGKLSSGAPTGGVIIVVSVTGERITAIRQQPLFGGTPPHAAPIKLTNELKTLVDNALATRHTMIVAYVGPDGQPILSGRGSTRAFSDDQLAIWVRNSDGLFLDSIKSQSQSSLDVSRTRFQVHVPAPGARKNLDRRGGTSPRLEEDGGGRA